MSSCPSGWVIQKTQILLEQDVVLARQKTRTLAEILGFDRQDQVRLSTAVSELARNAFQYARGGTLEFLITDRSDPQYFAVCVRDRGPGIADLETVLSGQYVSSTGMGVGLLGSKKLMDLFEVESSQQGTTVVVGKELQNQLLTSADIGRLSKQLTMQGAGGPFEELRQQNLDLVQALQDLQASKQELQAVNRELAETNRGVVALYAELDERAAAIQRANEIKTSFLSHITHEFRTPLTSIISLTRMLLDRTDGELSAEQEKQTTYIRSSAETLLEIVNDLLDLAKVEAGKISVDPAGFTVEEVMGGLRGVFRPLMGHHAAVKLTFVTSDSEIQLFTDQVKLSQILRNLIANAMKFTEHGEVRVEASPGSNETMVFKVIDTGIGIAESDLETIFQDFTQVNSKLQRRSKGTGLGLPLSLKLARLLGGSLAVTSRVGAGSTFTLEIPRLYSGAGEGILFGEHVKPEKNHSAEPDERSKFRVLLADDDEPSRYVLKNQIRGELDADFVEVSNGQMALSFLRGGDVDVIFLDLGMPEMDGFETLKRLKEDARLSTIPVIVNTAKMLSDGELEFLRERTVAVLSKEDDRTALSSLHDALVKAGFDYRRLEARP